MKIRLYSVCVGPTRDIIRPISLRYHSFVKAAVNYSQPCGRDGAKVGISRGGNARWPPSLPTPFKGSKAGELDLREPRISRPRTCDVYRLLPRHMFQGGTCLVRIVPHSSPSRPVRPMSNETAISHNAESRGASIVQVTVPVPPLMSYRTSKNIQRRARRGLARGSGFAAASHLPRPRTSGARSRVAHAGVLNRRRMPSYMPNMMAALGTVLIK